MTELMDDGRRWRFDARASSFRLAAAAAGLFAFFLLGGVWLTFGSVGAAADAWNGIAVRVTPSIFDFGEIQADRDYVATFRLANRTSSQLTVLGAETRCTCVIASDLPRVLGPNQSTDIHVRLKQRSSIPGGRIKPGLFTKQGRVAA